MLLPDRQVLVDDLKVLVDLHLVRAPLIETHNVDRLVVQEEVVQVTTDLVLVNVLANSVNLVSRILRRNENKLDVVLRNHPQFIKIVQVEQKTHLLLEVRIAKNNKPRKQLQRIYNLILVRIPNLKCLLRLIKNLVKLSSRNRKRIANRLK